jgi:threonine dehydratase
MLETVEERVLRLRLVLPKAPPRGGLYCPARYSNDGRYVCISGQPPVYADRPMGPLSFLRGKVAPASHCQEKGYQGLAAKGSCGGFAPEKLQGQRTFNTSEAKEAARLVGLAMLATLRQELGSLNRVKGLVKTLGMVNGTPDFQEHAVVINGFSELMQEVFGDEGVGSRSAVGMGSLPFNIPVEVEATFEVAPPECAVTLHEVAAAHKRMGPHVLRTPLLPLQWDPPKATDGSSLAPPHIFVKAENLQPTVGSYKLRPAANNILEVLSKVGHAALMKAGGIVTASSGNWAQGCAHMCAQTRLPFTVIVPEQCPDVKLAGVLRVNPAAKIVRLSFDKFMGVVQALRYPADPKDGPAVGHFISSVFDKATIAANGTIGLEILEELPSVDAIIVPFGGGAMTVGIALAVAAATKGRQVDVYAAEIETLAPLTAAREAGRPVQVELCPSFVDGIGNTTVFPPIWDAMHDKIADCLTVSVEEAARTVSLLALRTKLVVEGASAVSVAAAIKYRERFAGKSVACVLSGGSINGAQLAAIFGGSVPGKPGSKL